MPDMPDEAVNKCQNFHELAGLLSTQNFAERHPMDVVPWLRAIQKWFTRALTQADHIVNVNKMVSGNDEQPDTSEAVRVLVDALEHTKSFIEMMPKGIGRGAAGPLYQNVTTALKHPAVIAAMKGEDRG